MTTATSSPYTPAESNMNHQASANFQEYVDTHRNSGMDGYGASKSYITYDDLERYWTPENIHQILSPLNPPFVLSRDEVDKVTEHFLRVLSILTYIGKVGHFQWFFTHNQDDDRLPHESKPYGLPRGDELYQAFSSAQWRFCPFDFSKAPYMRPLDPNCILPITILENLSPVTADSSRPVIQKVALKSTRYRQGEERVAVFKTYNGVEASHVWGAEFETFQAISKSGHCEHIVRCLGSFKQKETDKYTIILEYADGGTLLDLFREDKPPLKHADRVQLWERLFDLLKGLVRIHGLPSDRNSKSLMCLKSIHLDIKPANILVFRGEAPGPQNCRFKLADFGSSPTRLALAGQAIRAEDTGGTPMYSPPECCRDDRYLSYETLEVGPEADIWSLGCVFSEVLVWMLLREAGRKDYERRRVEATKKLPRLTAGGYTGCFHIVNARLATVDEMHDEAQQYSQRGDMIMSLVSDIILRHMLRPELPGRLPPANLHRVFKDGVEGRTQPMIKPLPDEVIPQESKLKEIRSSRDQKSKTWTSGTSSNDDRHPVPPSGERAQRPPKAPQARHAARSSSIILPMVTVADVNEWREREGGSLKRISRLLGTRHSVKELEGMSNLQQLQGRDQYFIIDDSRSMKNHRKEVVQTFQALAYLVKRVDDDGLDMYFTSAPKKEHHNRDSGPLVNLIQQQKMEGLCMMNLSLDSMADVIIERNLKVKRPVSVYVLTDGNWGLRGDSLGDVDKVVERLVRELEARNEASSFVALQFIRFGNLPEGIKRLRKLDNLAKPSSKNPRKKVLERDIVDHSSYTDSVWKMLIGSLVEGVDNGSDDDSDSDENMV